MIAYVRAGDALVAEGLERAALWHDAEAARLDAIAAIQPRAPRGDSWAVLADEHRRSAAAIRAMKEHRS